MYRVLVSAIAAALCSAALFGTATATPKLKQTPKAASSPRPSPSPAPVPGSAVGLLTWQYNDFVGTKPDVGASACLIPLRATKVVADDAKGVMLDAHLGIDTTINKYGWVCGKADGSGAVNLDAVPPGTYTALVISEKTTRNFKAPLSDLELQILGFRFDPDAVRIVTMEPSVLLLRQWSFVSTIVVRSGTVSHFSYDFGHTYF
ncbi:MAG: hypothetical protein JWN27_2959 [Candidatus Eremiobacteraeota bacterium]|nr:hypothetical protein [Candidatus Eremiobacteraeota bacterium]